MLELHNVILKPRQQAVSLTVNDGQLVCLSGPEGAGKTSVLRAVMGLRAVDSGHISIDGELLTPLSAPYFRRQMAYVPSRLVPIPGQDRVGDVRRLLFGLSANRALKQQTDDVRLWCELTLAEQYLELLTCASLLKRPLVLVDEPLSALDWEAQNAVARLLQHMVAGGTSVLVVSNAQPVQHLTNHVIQL